MKVLRIGLIVTLFLFLTGCISMDRIEDNFTEAGYEYQTDASEFIGATVQSIQDDDVPVETHVFVNGIDVAVVLEFESRDDLNDQIENNEALKEWLNEEDNSEYIRSTFLLIPVTLNSDTEEEMVEIFNE